VAVIAPVIVAVHVNVIAPVIVIATAARGLVQEADRKATPVDDDHAHAHVCVHVHVHVNDPGGDHGYGHVDDDGHGGRRL
jgi:hypothetical protein